MDLNSAPGNGMMLAVIIMSNQANHQSDELRRFIPAHQFLVGIDSDGCVLDTMESKQRHCFHPAIINQWQLQPIAEAVRQTAEYVNLYSPWRGQNRYLNLIRVMELLRDHPAVGERCAIPELSALKALAEKNSSLSLEMVRRAAHNSDELTSVRLWSESVDRCIALTLSLPSVFPEAADALRQMADAADLVVISQTPNDALQREWQHCGLQSTVRAVAGQEAGSKSEQLMLATKGRYDPRNVLFVGDAPGDAQAARELAAFFYPILPGQEAVSWARLAQDAFPRFIGHRFDPAYAAARLEEFEALLPAQPPWINVHGSQFTVQEKDKHDE